MQPPRCATLLKITGSLQHKQPKRALMRQSQVQHSYCVQWGLSTRMRTYIVYGILLDPSEDSPRTLLQCCLVE